MSRTASHDGGVPPALVHSRNVGRALRADVLVKSQDVLLELRQGGGTNDGGGDKPPGLAPCKRQLRGRHAVLFSDLFVLRYCLLHHGLAVPLHVPREKVEAGLGVHALPVVLAAQGSTSQGAVRQQPHVVAAARLRQVVLELVAHQQRVAVLDAHDLGQALGLGEPAELAHAVRGLVGHTNPPHLACLDDILHALQLLLKRHVTLPLLRGVVRAAAKQRHVPVRPVDLQQVDVVGAQALEAGIHALLDLLARDARGAWRVAHPSGALRVAADLASQHDAVPLAPLHPAANVLVGQALSLRLGGHRVHLCSVHEVDAHVPCV
mmetsp:Transcript_21691/g.55231  ORF Transcript_21691/g.55231 Transcript_21691/m.55231 type:complete len:321 (+) Transcript_21691:414-1376(+)